MLEFLSVDTVMLTVLGYPMSWIEFFGTVFNLWCVWLVAKNRVLNWPVGIVGILLFGALFWQIRLYADLFEQVYFFVTSLWGWWVWLHPRSAGETDIRGELAISGLNRRGYAVYGVVLAVGTVVLTFVTMHLHQWLPGYFPEAASYPLLDSFTTVMSFAATVLMVRRKIESWHLWIAVDIIGIGLYWAKDVHLVSLLYAVFLVNAVNGLIRWSREHRARIPAVQHT
ncbi:MAG TPA: nicotinamide riboside transporter PnuC [Candidatus Paceibacterota bacterium]|nr:nicotinamide riboside transporter PnuC [Candidatus Paceibacterota bacterium]